MAANSKIEWTHHTFNHVRGCTRVAPECKYCYADALSKRNPSTLGVWGDNGTRVVAAESYWKEPLKWNRQAAAAGERHRVFCASLADVFEDWDGPMSHHESGFLHRSTDGWIVIGELDRKRMVTMDDVRHRLFALIDATPHLDWLLLTKRPENILRMWPRANSSHPPEPEPQRRLFGNVWLGTSAGTQATADKNIPELLKCRDLAPVLFVSAEPLLGSVDLQHVQWQNLTEIDCLNGTAGVIRPHGGHAPSIDWVICGGESGPHARPMHPDWARSLRDQCQSAGVPFFFKQWGEYIQPDDDGDESIADDILVDRTTKCGYYCDETVGHVDHGAVPMRRLGKKQTGRHLDGVEHNEFPKPVCLAGQ